MNFASRASRAPSLGSLSAGRTSFISGVKPPHRASAFPGPCAQSLHPALGNPFSWPQVNLGSCRFHIETGTGNFDLLVESHNLSGTHLREGTLTYLDTSANILLSDTAGFSSVSTEANT